MVRLSGKGQKKLSQGESGGRQWRQLYLNNNKKDAIKKKKLAEIHELTKVLTGQSRVRLY